MKSSDVAMDQQQQVSQLMDRHDKRRSVQVDWRGTKIKLGGFFGRDNNDPWHELSRLERHGRRSDGRSYATDEDVLELADLLDAAINRKKHRSYINDSACGKACRIRDGKSHIQRMSEHLRRTGQLPPGRSYTEFSGVIR